LKLNLGQVLSNLAQSASGMMAGQAAAEQELRRRQLEQQERQRQFDSTMLNILPSLSRDSQGLVIGKVLGGRANVAAGRPYDYQAPAPVDMSNYQGPFGGGGRAPLPMGGDASAPTEFARFVGGLGGPQVENPPIRFALSAPPPPMIPGSLPPVSTPMAGEAGVGSMPVPPTVPPHTERIAPVSAAAPPPAAPPAPPKPSGRTFNVPGFGELSLRGVDPKEAKGIVDAIGKSRATAFSSAFVKDPQTQTSLRNILSRVPTKPFDQWDENDLSQARQAQADFDSTVLFLGKQNPQIQGEMDRAEVKQIDSDLGKLSGFRADNLQQELIRLKGRARGLMERGFVQLPSQLMAQLDDIELMEKALASGDTGKAGLILGLVRQELTPKPKDADPLKAFDSLLGQAARWAGVDPATQGVYLKRLKQAAQDAGIDPSIIPNRVEAVMSDESKQRIGLAKDQFKLAQQREARVAAEQKWRRDFDTRKANQQKRAEAGNLTETEHKRIGKLEEAREAQYQRKNAILQMAPVDLKPGSDNPATRGISAIDKEIERLNGAIEGILGAAEKRGGGTATPAGGKAKTGAMIRDLADPNRSENQKAKPDPKWKTYRFDNPARLAFRKVAYDAAIARGKSPAEAAKWADEKTAAFQPEAKRK
jgi:hypothetical protein